MENEIKKALENYEMGFVNPSELIELFIRVNDAPSDGTPKVNAITAGVVREREKLLAPLADKCKALLELSLN